VSLKSWCNRFNVQGAFKKFCNSTIKKKGNVTNYTLFFNIIPTEFNAFATFSWQAVNSTKIEIVCLFLHDSFFEHLIVRIATGVQKVMKLGMIM